MEIRELDRRAGTVCPAGPPPPTRGTSEDCSSWRAARATPARRCWPPGAPCARGPGWCSWGCPGTSGPSWPSSATRPCPSPCRSGTRISWRRPGAVTRPSSAPAWAGTPRTERLVRSLLADLDRPVVLDADGINALAGHIHILDGRSTPTVLTPTRGSSPGSPAVSCPSGTGWRRPGALPWPTGAPWSSRGPAPSPPPRNGRLWLNGTGGPGMAKGGSGDVLAGMIAALWGQKHLNGPGSDRSELAALAVWYHGAGDRCARRLGEYAMLPGTWWRPSRRS